MTKQKPRQERGGDIGVLSIFLIGCSLLLPFLVLARAEEYLGSHALTEISDVFGVTSVALFFSLAVVPARRLTFPAISAGRAISAHRLMGFLCASLAVLHVLLFVLAEPVSARYLTTYAPRGMIFGQGAICLLFLAYFGSYSLKRIGLIYKNRHEFTMIHVSIFFVCALLISLHLYFCNFIVGKKSLVVAESVILGGAGELAIARLSEGYGAPKRRYMSSSIVKGSILAILTVMFVCLIEI